MANSHMPAASTGPTNRFGRPVTVDDLRAGTPFGLMITGCSVVSHNGVRFGKGHGYFDVEWAVMSELGKTDERTAIVVVCHDVQVRDTDLRPAPMTRWQIGSSRPPAPSRSITHRENRAAYDGIFSPVREEKEYPSSRSCGNSSAQVLRADPPTHELAANDESNPQDIHDGGSAAVTDGQMSVSTDPPSVLHLMESLPKVELHDISKVPYPRTGLAC